MESSPDDLDDFYRAGPELDRVTLRVPGPKGSDDSPALRELGRPPSWGSATSPESLLGPQYDSAALRAEEVLKRIAEADDRT